MPMSTMVHDSAHIVPRPGPTAGDVRIADLSNDSIIIRLHFAINHLSRWLTPIHDTDSLDRVVFRGQPSIKELVIQIREEERRVFPMLYAMASEDNPDLDRLPVPSISPEQEVLDRTHTVLTVLSEFRRLRQSTCSLLRSLTDAGWLRVGTSRTTHDWQIRTLAEALVANDEQILTQIDVALDRYGLREGVAEHGRAHLYELLKIIPVTVRAS
jgi:hypothetical protein